VIVWAAFFGAVMGMGAAFVVIAIAQALHDAKAYVAASKLLDKRPQDKPWPILTLESSGRSPE
jgi:hypothetical protein